MRAWRPRRDSIRGQQPRSNSAFSCAPLVLRLRVSVPRDVPMDQRQERPTRPTTRPTMRGPVAVEESRCNTRSPTGRARLVASLLYGVPLGGAPDAGGLADSELAFSPCVTTTETMTQAESTYDAAGIVAAIRDRALCVECIARKAHVRAARIEDVLIRIGHEVQATITVGPCDTCHRSTVTYKLR